MPSIRNCCGFSNGTKVPLCASVPEPKVNLTNGFLFQKYFHLLGCKRKRFSFNRIKLTQEFCEVIPPRTFVSSPSLDVRVGRIPVAANPVVEMVVGDLLAYLLSVDVEADVLEKV